MNTFWKFLIFIGIAFLLITAGWEFYQVSTGGRRKFEVVVNEIDRNYLISPGVRSFLEKDQDYITFSPADSSN